MTATQTRHPASRLSERSTCALSLLTVLAATFAARQNSVPAIEALWFTLAGAHLVVSSLFMSSDRRFFGQVALCVFIATTVLSVVDLSRGELTSGIAALYAVLGLLSGAAQLTGTGRRPRYEAGL